MSIPNVTFEYENGRLGGNNPTQDGICGLIIQVPVAPTGLVRGVAKAIYSLSDAVSLGITQDFDSINSCSCYGEIADFYGKTGGKGELWIMLVADTTSLEDICNQTNDIAAKLLLDSNGRVRVLGIAANRDATSYNPEIEGIDKDIYNAMATAQALRKTFALQRYIPIRVILPGRAFNGEASALRDLSQASNNGVLISMHGRKGSKEARIGFILGIIASLSVQRNIGRVLNGDLGVTEAYLTDGVTRAEDIFSTQDTINDKCYVIPIVRPGRAGYFYNDDPTATSKTDDYNSLANGRVIDKVQRIAYDTFLDFVNDDFGLSLAGKISISDLKRLQGDIEDNINATMVSGGELSSFRCYVDGEQDPIATGYTEVELYAQPRGYYRQIKVKLGFVKEQIQ